MPTYEYACTACGQHLEVSQSFSDDPLTTCPECGGPLRKVFSPVGIVLKGSGFYKTDSRAPATGSSRDDGSTKEKAGTGQGSGAATTGGSSEGSATSKDGSGSTSSTGNGSGPSGSGGSTGSGQPAGSQKAATTS